MSLKDVSTASPSRSIWLDLNENTFRRHLVTLEECTNAIPIHPQVFAIEDWLPMTTGDNHILPIGIEQRVANDFAWLVAVAEGAQSVAAVCIEEHIEPAGLKLRFAALDVSIDNDVQSTLQIIFDILAKAASGFAENGSSHINMIFNCVVKLHLHRLLGRLRSTKWKRPEYLSRSQKKPLWQDFENLIHRAQFLYDKKEKMSRQFIERKLEELATIYEQFETSENDLTSLMDLIDATFAFCSLEEAKDFSQRLQVKQKPKPQTASAIKSLRQLKKIAAYRRICVSLVATAKQYPNLFQHITMTCLTPYKSVPTSIRYQDWATSCHVHAEIQLAVHYDLNRDFQPRCIGTSKWLCYLCYLFLQAHKRMFPSNTHGHLYDQWTVPDSEDFGDDLVQRYRNILKAMDDEILRQIEIEPEFVRLEPMTSCTSE
jgi:hypothetical protein